MTEAIAKKDEIMTKGDTQAMIKHIVAETVKATADALEKARPVNSNAGKMLTYAEVEGFATIIEAADLYLKDGKTPPPVAKAQAMAKIMLGHADGLDPIASQSAYHVINGKMTRGIDAYTAKIKSSGRYDYKILEHTNEVCTIRCFEKVVNEWVPLEPDMSFSLEDAKKAKLADGSNAHSWAKYTKDMLFARAITRCFKRHFGALNSAAERQLTEEDHAEALASAIAYESKQKKEAGGIAREKVEAPLQEWGEENNE